MRSLRENLAKANLSWDDFTLNRFWFISSGEPPPVPPGWRK